MTNYNSNFQQTIPFGYICAQVALGANAEETYTVPGAPEKSFQLRFTYTQSSNVFVNNGATPTIPGAGSTGTEANTEYRPGSDGSKRYAKGGDVIHLITPDTSAYVGIVVTPVP
jgi:hypothetical protein